MTLKVETLFLLQWDDWRNDLYDLGSSLIAGNPNYLINEINDEKNGKKQGEK